MIKIARIPLDLQFEQDVVIPPEGIWISRSADVTFVIGLESIIIDCDMPVNVKWAMSHDNEKWTKWMDLGQTTGREVEYLKHPELLAKLVRYLVQNPSGQSCTLYEFKVLTREYAI